MKRYKDEFTISEEYIRRETKIGRYYANLYGRYESQAWMRYTQETDTARRRYKYVF